MALTGNEPISADNLRELSEGGAVGGKVLFMDENGAKTGTLAADVSQFSTLEVTGAHNASYDYSGEFGYMTFRLPTSMFNKGISSAGMGVLKINSTRFSHTGSHASRIYLIVGYK